jgi:hypothetical protein
VVRYRNCGINLAQPNIGFFVQRTDIHVEVSVDGKVSGDSAFPSLFITTDNVR